MSALAKPLVNTPNVIGGASDAVNIEMINAMSKITIDPTQTQPAVYEIVFTMSGENSSPREVKWRYESEVLRDTDFTALIALASNTLA